MVTFKSRGDSQKPVNLAGVGFYDIEEIDVALITHRRGVFGGPPKALNG